MEECMICLEPMIHNIVHLSCGHKYHYNCIQSWMKVKNNKKKICTICDHENEIINIENYREELTFIPKTPSPPVPITYICCSIL